MKSRRYPRQVLLGVLATLIALSALAHHSGSMWDSSRTVTLAGNVKEFQWSNPHCWIQLLVPGADGAAGGTQEWSIEMAAPIQMRQGGWKPGTLKPGDGIQVTVHPARDGSHAGNFMSAVTLEGQPLESVPQEHRP